MRTIALFKLIIRGLTSLRTSLKRLWLHRDRAVLWLRKHAHAALTVVIDFLLPPKQRASIQLGWRRTVRDIRGFGRPLSERMYDEHQRRLAREAAQGADD